MSGILHDVRYALRGFAKSPGFVLVAVVILAVGIGASVAIVSLVDTVYLRELPARDPSRLVEIYQVRDTAPGDYFNLSYPDYLEYRKQSRSFEDLAAHYSSAPIHIADGERSGEINGSVVTANYFRLLGIEPALGRFFRPEEDRVPGRDAVVVMAYDLWQSRFGGDPTVLGRTVRLNNVAFTVVGVAPRSFHGVPLGGLSTEAWMPSALFRIGYRYCDAFQRGCNVVKMLGRLKPGVSRRAAQTELDVIAGRLAGTYPQDLGLGVFVAPARGLDVEYRNDVGRPAPLLLGLAGLLLTLACANLAGLLLARGSARRREIAIRVTLGASRARIVRQLLAESVLLSIAGGALGVLVAAWANEIIRGLYSVDIEGRRMFFAIGLETPVVLFAVAISVTTGIVFGLAPALDAARTDLAAAAREGARGSAPRSRLLDGLVVFQIALSLVLATGAGLLLVSLRNIYGGPGFDPSQIVLLRLRPTLVGYDAARAEAFQREALRRVELLPGVRAASPAQMPPLPGWGHRAAIWLPGRPPLRPEEGLRAVSNAVGPRYLETLGVRPLEGREFDDRDRPGGVRVAMVNETLARTLWPGQTSLGASLVVDGSPVRVVGVVRNLQYRSAGEPEMPCVYTDFWQDAIAGRSVDLRLHVRVDGNPGTMLAAIRRVIVDLDPEVPISEDRPLTEWLDYSFQPVRVAGAVLSSFGAMGLLLSAIGLYGVLAFLVAGRRREIAIRMAIGADAARVARSVVGKGLRLAISGAAVGTAATLASAPLAATWLYGVAPADAGTLLGAVALLLGVALVACYLPARRAARLDPMTVLKTE
jgi:predicted permease